MVVILPPPSNHAMNSAHTTQLSSSVKELIAFLALTNFSMVLTSISLKPLQYLQKRFRKLCKNAHRYKITTTRWAKPQAIGKYFCKRCHTIVSDQYTKAYAKASRMLGLIGRSSCFKNVEVMLELYKTLV
jgi:hypothetical protein